MSGEHHVAQINLARLLAPIEDPAIADFVAALDPVNARADGAPGFVWRLQTDEGDATAVRAVDDPLVIVNLSVWRTIEALEAFAYRDDGHREVLRARRRWFERPAEPHVALWWVPAGTVPQVEDAIARLVHLRMHGATASAFTFRQRFPPPGSAD